MTASGSESVFMFNHLAAQHNDDQNYHKNIQTPNNKNKKRKQTKRTVNCMRMYFKKSTH